VESNFKLHTHSRLIRHVEGSVFNQSKHLFQLGALSAQFSRDGYTVCEETLDLARCLVRETFLTDISPCDVWAGLQQGLLEKRPSTFIVFLRDCGALKICLPEINTLFNTPQSATFHPEGDVGTHTLLVLDKAADLSSAINVRFAALLHDIGKGLTPSSDLPRHIGHERRGLELLPEINRRLGNIPSDCYDLVNVVIKNHLLMHRLEELKPRTVLRLLEAVRAVPGSPMSEDFILTCQADSQGKGNSERPYPPADLIRRYSKALGQLRHENAAIDQTSDKSEHFRQQQLQAIATVKQAWGAKR